MLEVIGAGATADSNTEWHRVWKMSAECAQLQTDLLAIESDGRQCPASQSILHSTYATSWSRQLYFLVKRGFVCYWRNPSYLIAKLVLNIVAGLFVGFTFLQSWKHPSGHAEQDFRRVYLDVPRRPALESGHRRFPRQQKCIRNAGAT